MNEPTPPLHSTPEAWLDYLCDLASLVNLATGTPDEAHRINRLLDGFDLLAAATDPDVRDAEIRGAA